MVTMPYLWTWLLSRQAHFKMTSRELEYITKFCFKLLCMLRTIRPSLIPPKEIDDPEDKKPVDWDDRQK